MKKLAIAYFTILISVFLYAQKVSADSPEYPWHLLEQGKDANLARLSFCSGKRGKCTKRG